MMKSSRQACVTWTLGLIACLCLGFGPFAFAQDAGGTPPKKVEEKKISVKEQRARAIARCRENRGVDCKTPEGLKEWIRQERPITDLERTQAAGARRAREAAKHQ